MRIIPAVFRPRPVGEIRGLKIAYVSTAPGAILEILARYLEDHYGCEVVAVSGRLSDRRGLAGDLQEMRGLGVEAYLTEIKAAAVDVVTRRGAEEGKPCLVLRQRTYCRRGLRWNRPCATRTCRGGGRPVRGRHQWFRSTS
jgi:predicted GTPase